MPSVGAIPNPDRAAPVTAPVAAIVPVADILPVTVKAPEARVPVVLRFSLLNEIAPEVSVIEPVFRDRVLAATILIPVAETISLAAPIPPSVCIDPVTLEVESVTSSVIILPPA